MNIVFVLFSVYLYHGQTHLSRGSWLSLCQKKIWGDLFDGWGITRDGQLEKIKDKVRT